MLIFRLVFILADKISRFAKSWLPIQNLNSVVRSEIPYLNWRYNFVTFSQNFCQNAWISSLRTNPNNGVFRISTVVMRTRNIQVPFHIINSWVFSILEITVCIFSLRNLCNVQFYVDHILLSKIQVELFSLNIKLPLEGSVSGSVFYIFEKYGLSAFTGKKLMP